MTTSIDAPRALILAAGLGSRLRPLTLETPKPLVEVHGTPILHNALRGLARMGVREATLVVGYRSEVIQSSCKSEFAGVRITYAPSTAYEHTGSAYSLWLARDTLLRGDTLVLEGDVFFEPAILARLLASRHANVGAVAPFTDALSGSAVTLTDEGQIDRFLMNRTAADCNGVELFKTVNLYRFSAATLRERIVPALDAAMLAGEQRCYVEQILSRLIDARGLTLNAALCGDLDWFEIDSADDLRIAETIFAPRAAAERRELQTCV